MIDFDRLLKLRLVVARVGEMDLARWWNTRGMLGRHGAVVLQRGLPRTHRFAQARVVFAVARSRCHELFDPPGCMTLWHLPAEIEDRFEDRWQAWLDEAGGVDGVDMYSVSTSISSARILCCSMASVATLNCVAQISMGECSTHPALG